MLLTSGLLGLLVILSHGIGQARIGVSGCIAGSDLAQLCLALRAMGIEDPSQIEWLDAPPEMALKNAEKLLELLVATEEDARKMMRLPLHPRLSRMIAAAMDRGVGRAACITAVLLSSGERLEHNDLLAAIDEPFAGYAWLIGELDPVLLINVYNPFADCRLTFNDQFLRS